MRFKKTDYFLGASAVLFLILKITEMQFKFSDGFTYMYMGRLILNGFVPYRNFFFASPPFQAYVMAFFEIFTGSNFLILKLIPILATVGSSIFIYLYIKKKFGGWQGLTASILFLFSFLVLLTTDYNTGISLTLLFLIGMIYFIEEDKPIIAGLFGSLAALTRLYAPFVILGALLFYLICRRRETLKFILGLAVIFVPISLIFEIISHGAYLNQIFFFRLNLISGIGLDKFSVIGFFLVGDFILILGTLFYFIFDKEKKKLLLPLLATAGSVILYAVYSDIYYLYFGLIIAFFAMFTAKFIFEFSDSKNFRRLLVLFLILFMVFNSLIYISNYATASNIKFTSDITNFVVSNSGANDTIYGSFEITPLVGLLSGRPLAGNIADTNPKNIMTSEFNISEIEKKISGVRFIIEKGTKLSDGTLTGFDDSTPLDYIASRCNLTKTYPVTNDLNGANVVVVWECD